MRDERREGAVYLKHQGHYQERHLYLLSSGVSLRTDYITLSTEVVRCGLRRNLTLSLIKMVRHAAARLAENLVVSNPTPYRSALQKMRSHQTSKGGEAADRLADRCRLKVRRKSLAESLTAVPSLLRSDVKSISPFLRLCA